MSGDAPSARPESGRGRIAQSVAVLSIALAGTFGYGRFLNTLAYPLKEWLFWHVGALWAYCVFLSLACVSAGHLLLARLFRKTDLPTLEAVVASFGLGLVTFVLGMYAGGAVRLFNPIFAVALPATMLLAGLVPLVRFGRARADAYRANPTPRTALGTALAGIAATFGVIGALFVYLGAFTPDAINFDASWCHITVAQDYARAGRLIPFPGDYAKTVPHLASIVQTWGYLVPGLGQPTFRWMMVLHLEFMVFLWTLAGAAAMTRWLVATDEAPDSPAPRATWAALFLFPAILVYDHNLGGAADHYLAFFTPLMFLAAMRARTELDGRGMALAGVFGAGAMLTKYQAMYPLFGIGLILAFRWACLAIALAVARVRGRSSGGPTMGASPPNPGRPLLVAPAAFLGAFALVASPHFLKNLVFYHNPLYPFEQDVFTHSTPTTPNAAFLFEWLFKDYNWRPHGTLLQNLKDGAELVFTYSFAPHYSFTKNVPNAGSLFTLCLPFLLVLRGSRRLWLGAITSVAALFFWAMTFRVDRNLQTFAPILAATTAGLLVRAWDLGWVARLGVAPLVALQVIWGGDALVYSGQARVKGAIDMIRGGFDGRRDDRYEFRREFRDIGKALPANAKVLLHGYRPNLGIDRDLYLDWAGQQALFLYEGLKSSREIYDYWRARGITHLIHLPAYRPAPSKLDDVLFTDFVARYAKSKKRFGGFELVELPDAPPPVSRPYKAMSFGLWGYRDGIYPIELMKTYEAIPDPVRTFPPPPEPMPAKAEEVVAALDEVDVVLEAKGAKVDALVRETLAQKFFQGTSYGKSFTIWLKKGDMGIHVPSPPGGPPSQPEDDEPER